MSATGWNYVIIELTAIHISGVLLMIDLDWLTLIIRIIRIIIVRVMMMMTTMITKAIECHDAHTASQQIM